MTIINLQRLENTLNKALLDDGAMSSDLYDLDLKPEISYLRKSLKRDKDDYIFGIISKRHIPTDSYKIAMVVIHKSHNLQEGKIYVNEAAREKLKKLWVEENYTNNMKMMIPAFANSLHAGELAITGIRIDYSKGGDKKLKKGFA